MRAVAVAVVAGLALVFAISVRAHVRDPDRLRDVLSEIGLPGGIAHGVLVAQASVVGLLVLAPRVGLLAAAGFLAAASGVFIVSVLLGRTHHDCGCFSGEHPVDAAFFLRNAVFGSLALVAWYWAPVGPLGAVLGRLASQ